MLMVLLILSATNVFSQLPPLNTIDINTTYVPESKYRQKDGDLQNTEKTQKRIDLGYSFMISNKVDTSTRKMDNWTAMLNGSYTWMGKPSNEHDLMPNRLFSTQFAVVNYHSISRKWGMVKVVQLGLNTDLRKFDIHDLFLSGGLLFIKNQSSRFSFGFGVFVANATNAPLVLPAVTFQLRSEGKFKFNIDLPTEVSSAYEPNKKMELKLALRFRNLSYDVENKLSPKKRYLNYMELPLGLEGKWKSKRFDFTLGGGYMFIRNFQLKEGGIKNMFKSTPTNKLNGNIYVNAGISYRLKPASK
ncbi:hypothetical protein DBR43_21095 [Pedobacter sp. KBW06]|nr:hypothetical protein DBR43_21095 [Pedobacter sp. KBW06]